MWCVVWFVLCGVCVMWFVLSVAWCVLCGVLCGVCYVVCVVCCVVCVGVVGRPVVQIARGFNGLKFIINYIVIVVVSFLVSRRRAFIYLKKRYIFEK